MAKTTMPLLSGTASGKFGNDIVFDKRGWARVRVIPANPQSVDQMTVRNRLGDIQKELKQMGPTLRAAVKLALGYRWNTLIVSELTAYSGDRWADLLTAYTAYSSPNKANWASADPGVGLVNTAGFVFYAVAVALYDVTFRVSGDGAITEPTETNSATIATEWAA